MLTMWGKFIEWLDAFLCKWFTSYRRAKAHKDLAKLYMEISNSTDARVDSTGARLQLSVERVKNKQLFGEMFMRQIIGGIAIAIAIIVATVASFSLFENVPAGYICVIQSPITGELTVHTDPGLKWQGGGSVTMYPRTGVYEFLQPINPFSEDKREAAAYNKSDDKSHQIAFNDGGFAFVSGSIRYDYPTSKEQIEVLHRMFSNHHAVIDGLISKITERSIYMSGPLMTSIDSYMSRRSDLPRFIEDQARNGLYEVNTRDVAIEDEFTKERKIVKQAEPLKDSKAPGGLKRQDESILTKYGMSLSNLSIKVTYDPKVQGRINALFAAASDIQLATMNAKKAEQDRKTAAEQGQAAAMTAEWRAKAIAAEKIAETQKEKDVAILTAEKERDTALLKAEQNLKVAEQEKYTAILYKEARLQRAEADSTYNRKMMESDGALAQKLRTFEAVQQIWADAFAKHQGSFVPQVVMGGGSSGGTPSSTDFMNMLMVKTAKDLALDTKVSNGK